MLKRKKLIEIKRICEAYPESIFPEPDFEKADRVLRDNGLSLTSISAYNMRYLAGRIIEIINKD
jgi:hypothetical protein